MKEIDITNLFFLEIIICFLIILLFIAQIHILKQIKQTQTTSLAKLCLCEKTFYYSSYLTKKIALNKLFNLANSPLLTLYQKAIKNPQQTSKQILKQIKQNPKDYNLMLLYANLCLIQNDTTNFNLSINKIKLPFFANKSLKANYLYLQAQNDLYNTDMYSASKNYSKALKLYQKLNFPYEIAQCYLAIAQAYRISGIQDVAFSMLKEAKKIYEKLSLHTQTAETIAYFGLTELGRENYNVALEYFAQSIDITKKHKLQKLHSDISNWVGLSQYLKKDFKNAQSTFTNIIKSKFSSTLALGFASEMLARINIKENKYKSALKNIDIALSNYQKNNHKSGIFENLYLKADIYYNQNKYNESKEILIQLIKQKNSTHSTYYIANAYTLLGLIYLDENKLNLAKTTFKQALDLENSNNRLKGAIIDYNNLAETSLKLGNEKEASKYLNIALEYAQKIEDNELINYIRSKLKD